MGTVFLAEQLALGSRRVALKILRRSLLEDPEFLKRFQDEAASTACIHHLNVITVYECGQSEDGSPYIAMEYLEGETLRQYLKREGSIPLEMAADILQQAGRGLNAAHKLGIIHRDVKPDNIFLTRDDDGKPLVKILDFGIAKMRESSTHTMTGLAVGTPTYMSVEQAAGMRSDQIDGRSDIYSLGIVVYEMIAGTLPFRADTPLAWVQKHLTQPPAPLSTARPDLNIPARVEDVVMKALKKDREERYATAPEFARAFTEAVVGTPLPFDSTPEFQGAAARPAIQTAAVSKTQRRGFLAVMMIAAAVLAMTAAALYWVRGKNEPKQAVVQQTKMSVPPAVTSPALTQTGTHPKQEIQGSRTQTTQALRTKTATQLRTRAVAQPAPDVGLALDLIKAQNYSQALPILRQAAAGGNVAGELYLADAYRNGWGLTQDYVQARHWYQKAADSGNIVAAVNLGSLYERGLGVQQDYSQARQWYEKGAAAGKTNAMIDLARLYEHGRGVPQDYAHAREWYEKAAAAGNSAAMIDIGHLYENGWGVTKDYRQARQWYEKSASAGDQAAAIDLARVNEKADRDRGQAEAAAAKPSPKAVALLEKARKELQSEDRARALADVAAAIKDSPNFAAAYLFRADWESSIGDTRSALADYTACIERSPARHNLIHAYRARAKLRERMGDTKGAEVDLEQVRRIETQSR